MRSSISGFYELMPEERLEHVRRFAGLDDADTDAITATGSLGMDIASRMIENVIGGYTLPLGIATNFLINGKDYLIPMVLEEPSVVAAASNAAKMARAAGGFEASVSDPVMIGQVQIVNLEDPGSARDAVLSSRERIIELCNEKDPMLVRLGGGAKGVEARIIDTPRGQMLIVHILVDVRDAMGANAVNTMAESLAPFLERITGGQVRLRIISNLARYRVARARATFPAEALGGEEVVEGILDAWAFAYADPFRCATHNKGVMNGISAVVIATGNDFRAVEAGAHSYAARDGPYRPLTTYTKNEDGDLVGGIEVPAAVGTVGGAIRVHPTARANLKILGVKGAGELGCVLASVGLAQNLAALRALAAEGIQHGHMRLHARNLAMSAGATPEEVDRLVAMMVSRKRITMKDASDILQELRSGDPG